MNIQPGHGKSSSPQLFAYGAGTPDNLVVHFHNAYRRSAEAADDQYYGIEELRHMMDVGHVMVCLIMHNNEAKCVFGLELFRDVEGPFFSFLFIYGDFADYAPEMVMAVYSAWKMHAFNMGFDGEGRVLIKGRKGWRRMLDRMNIFYRIRGNETWIFEFQPAFGFSWRQ